MDGKKQHNKNDTLGTKFLRQDDKECTISFQKNKHKQHPEIIWYGSQTHRVYRERTLNPFKVQTRSRGCLGCKVKKPCLHTEEHQNLDQASAPKCGLAIQMAHISYLRYIFMGGGGGIFSLELFQKLNFKSLFLSLLFLKTQLLFTTNISSSKRRVNKKGRCGRGKGGGGYFPLELLKKLSPIIFFAPLKNK